MKKINQRMILRKFPIIAIALLFSLLSGSAHSQCTSPINTIMNQNNNQDGNIFNVTALTDLTIDSVWCNFDPGTISEVEIWWRPGTAVGFQNSAAGWTLIDSCLLLTSAGINNFTKVPININLPVAQGTTVGLYITRAQLPNSPPYMKYRNGTGTAGNPHVTNGDMTISVAYGKDYPFGASFNPRLWNGRMFYHCCPPPPSPQFPPTGPTSVCQGDTVTYWINSDTLATSYEWNVPAGDSILTGQGDTLITVVIGPNSLGGDVCVALEDTCTTSNDTCITYTITQPVITDTIVGPQGICQNNSAWYSIAPQTGAIQYEWTVSNAVVIDSSAMNDSIEVLFSSGLADICVRYRDNCAWSEDTCTQVNASVQPNAANAGPDRTVCTGLSAQLNANPPNVGNGLWTIVNSPGPGFFSDSTSHTSTYTSAVAGQHILRWTNSSEGCPSTEDEMVVTIAITPTADFTTANVCEGTPVGFQDASTGNGATINSWLWDMDGDLVDNYVIQSPVHMYGSEGSYNVRLIVNAQGCADTLFKVVDVNPEPDLDISADNVCLNKTMSIDNNTTIPTGFISAWAFDFGDNTPVDSSYLNNYEPTHTYALPGPYTINAVAESNKGCLNSQSIQVRVYNLPVADFSMDNTCQYQEAVFSDESTVVGADIHAWEWDFGDGSASSIKQNPKHQYDVNGIVQLHLEVWSSFGCYDDTIANIEVYPTPETSFNFTNKVCLGDMLELESTSTISYGSLDKYDWVIDTLIFKQGKETEHLFDAIGTYPVTLTTTSNNGCTSSDTKLVPVYEVPEADFNLYNVCQGVEMQFDDTTYFDEPVKRYEWNFGDSTTLNDEHNPFHTYANYGTYDVSLYVESFRECTSMVVHPITIYERLLPRFTASPDSGCSPLQVEFIDSTESKTGVDWERKWVFGDGQEREDTAENIYSNYTGKFTRYDVTLQVTTAEGCESEYRIDSAVYVVPQPRASFTHSPDDLLSLSTKRPSAQFINTSRESNYYRWDFGDGKRSDEHNPFHEWKGEGVYEVMLTARNIYNCYDSAKVVVNVHHVNVPYIPSAFTPNGDGKNEVFKVEGLENLREMTMTIYDRWGNEIYEDKGESASWDGTNNQRKLVQQGLYFYRLVYVDSSGEEFELFGNISVLGIE